jgi:hypothetical protein
MSPGHRTAVETVASALALAVLLALSASACFSAPSANANLDAGEAETGEAVDAGPGDAGPTDAGVPVDAGPTSDAGAPLDAGRDAGPASCAIENDACVLSGGGPNDFCCERWGVSIDPVRLCVLNEHKVYRCEHSQGGCMVSTAGACYALPAADGGVAEYVVAFSSWDWTFGNCDAAGQAAEDAYFHHSLPDCP